MGVCIAEKSSLLQVFNKQAQLLQEKVFTNQQMVCKHYFLTESSVLIAGVKIWDFLGIHFILIIFQLLWQINIYLYNLFYLHNKITLLVLLIITFNKGDLFHIVIISSYFSWFEIYLNTNFQGKRKHRTEPAKYTSW